MPTLPPHPNLRQLKTEAKTILKRHRSGDPRACTMLRCLERFAGASDDTILAEHVTLNDVQCGLAAHYEFKSWAALRRHVLDMEDQHQCLHVFCLERPAGRLRREAVPGRIIAWLDPLMDGPVHHDVPYEAWLDARARQHADPAINRTVEGVKQWLKGQDEALATYPEYKEVVLWFDGCPYDQIILARHLDWFSCQDPCDTTLSLLCVGDYPDIDDYRRLDQLSGRSLVELLPTRHEVTPEEIQLGKDVWAAYRDTDPRAVEAVLAADTSALPWMGQALRHHLERFPSVANGLNPAENCLLSQAAQRPGEQCTTLIREMRNAMKLPYPSDFQGEMYIEDMVNAPTPLLKLAGPGDRGDQTVSITDAGRAVLAGDADAIDLNGIDRWLGGVHLLGSQAQYRWNAARGELVVQPRPSVLDAAEAGDLGRVKEWVTSGGDVDARADVNYTPLILAAGDGHLAVVKYLVENAADIDAQYKAGNTPLIVASWHGQLAVVNYLVDHGADIHHKNLRGDDA